MNVEVFETQSRDMWSRGMRLDFPPKWQFEATVRDQDLNSVGAVHGEGAMIFRECIRRFNEIRFSPVYNSRYKSEQSPVWQEKANLKNRNIILIDACYRREPRRERGRGL